MTAAVPGLTVRVRADRPSAVHLRAEIDLEVLCVVKDVEEGAALVKLGDAEEKKIKIKQLSTVATRRLNEANIFRYQSSCQEIPACTDQQREPRS